MTLWLCSSPFPFLEALELEGISGPLVPPWLVGYSGPTILPKQDHIEQVTQEHIQVGLSAIASKLSVGKPQNQEDTK